MREFKQILLKTPLFEFGIFRSEAAFPGEVRRSVALSHLLAFPRGASHIRRASGQHQVATPVGAVFYNRCCEYSAASIGSTTEVTGFLRVEQGVLCEVIQSFDPRVAERPEAPFALCDGPLPDCAFLAQAGIQRAAGSTKFDPLRAEESMVRLVRDVIRAAYAARSIRNKERPGKADADYARWTQELIAKDYRSAQSLAEIAARVGVSPFHLCRVFKRAVGMTMHEFRDRLRLRDALAEILDSSTPLVSIATRAGYSSQSHFTDAFRRRFGFAPAKCRKRLGAGLL